jgi:EAL domain-containing protein (putative c-di-GMP-specific phosphodiesterase class I)
MTPSLLVIDDQRLDRVIAASAGARAGLTTTGVGSIAEARVLLEQGIRFDFIVLDLSLDEEDGLEALPLIAKFNESAVVLFVSGFDIRVLAASQRIAASLGLRGGGVLRKPVVPNVLIELLRPHRQLFYPGETSAPALLSPGELRQALEFGAIQPWFQPKISLLTGRIVGTEALARWKKPDGSLLLPASFVPIAEQAGLASELLFTILGQSLKACAHWRRTRPDCWVAVNLTPLLLNDPSLPDRIDQELRTYGVPPTALVLEVTESSAIPDTPRAMEILTRLRIRGISLSIDDFGTGHSSLLSLVRMPFNEMKIDQTFVREALSNSDSRKVVRASASLGRELGLKVVAEGVETVQMAELVTEAGCDIGQGWLYGRAMPAAAFERALLQTSCETAVV